MNLFLVCCLVVDKSISYSSCCAVVISNMLFSVYEIKVDK